MNGKKDVIKKQRFSSVSIHQIRKSKAAMRMYLNHRRQKAQKTHGKTSVKTEERSVSYEKKRENPCAWAWSQRQYCSMSWCYPTSSLSIAPRLTKRHEIAWSWSCGHWQSKTPWPGNWKPKTKWNGSGRWTLARRRQRRLWKRNWFMIERESPGKKPFGLFSYIPKWR